MYYLNGGVSSTSLIVDQPDPTLLWHWRLGHPSLQKFQSVVHVESFVSTLSCASCELDKHHCLFFESGQ